MEEKRMYICPRCETWYSVHRKNTTPKCPECGQMLNFVNIDCEQFNWLSEKEREDLKRNYFSARANVLKSQSNYSEESNHTADPAAKNEKKNKDTSGWISLMETMCAIVIAAFMFTGAVVLGQYFQRGQYQIVGILIFLGMTLVGLLAVSGTMVFIGMAKDLKAIRNELEERL